MKTKKISSYKTEADRQFVENWIEEVQALNGRHYARLTVETAFGPTAIWSFNGDRPGAAAPRLSARRQTM